MHQVISDPVWGANTITKVLEDLINSVAVDTRRDFHLKTSMEKKLVVNEKKMVKPIIHLQINAVLIPDQVTQDFLLLRISMILVRHNYRKRKEKINSVILFSR